MLVRLKRGRSHPDFSGARSYAVLGIEADDLRLLGDTGRPFLYRRSLFDVVDETRPAAWVTPRGDDGEEYSYPRALARPGFFEDFFDGKARAVGAFWRTVNQRLAQPRPPARRRGRPARAA
jgi:hypothetical protein